MFQIQKHPQINRKSSCLCCLNARTVRGNAHVGIDEMCLVFPDGNAVSSCRSSFKSLSGHLKLAEIDCTIY